MVLNDPPLIPRLLFEQPWLLIGGLVAISVILLIVAARQGQKKTANLSIIPLIAAAIVLVLSMAVTTSREQLIDRTRQLIAAAGPMDTTTISQLFLPTANLLGPDGQSWLNRQQILSQLDDIDQRFQLKPHQLRQLQAEIRTIQRGHLQDRFGLSLIRLRTQLNTSVGEQSVNTQWLITWRQDENNLWKIESIKWLEFQGQPPAFGLWR